MTEDLMQKITSLSKRKGFIYQSSEIYGGISGVWDYGPYGVLLKNNIKNQWLFSMIQKREDMVGLDSAILMNPKVWKASGHTKAFTDPLVDCIKCKHRFRADHLVEKLEKEEEGVTTSADIVKLKKALKGITCPECGGKLTDPRMFNLLVPAYLGVIEDKKKPVWLRGETCQGIFVDYKLIRDSSRKKVPFGVAQIGKAFRNEITPGNFTFRSIEFEQMEMQYFVNPKEAEKWFEYWKPLRLQWYLDLGIKKNNLKLRQHNKDEKAHYAKDAYDIEYNYPFGSPRSGEAGWKELEGIHNRGDWDLSRHSKYSEQDLSYFDEVKKEKIIPYIIETSAGVDRTTLVFLLDAYHEEKIKGETRVVLKLDKRLSPIKVAVFPLLKNKPDLVKLAHQVYDDLKSMFMCEFDDNNNIGKRYRRQDEIGTPYCITVDFDSLKDKTVTIRDRDTMKQERVKVDKLADLLIDEFK
jgi:glycyl-tRNA synthetase